MPICRRCRQLVETRRVLCRHCYTPLTSTKPLSRRAMPILALAVLLAVLAGIIALLVRACLA